MLTTYYHVFVVTKGTKEVYSTDSVVKIETKDRSGRERVPFFDVLLSVSKESFGLDTGSGRYKTLHDIKKRIKESNNIEKIVLIERKHLQGAFILLDALNKEEPHGRKPLLSAFKKLGGYVFSF